MSRYGRAGDVNHAIEVGIHHRLEPLRTQLLERRDIAVPGVIHDNVETSECGNRRLALIAWFQIVGALPSTGRVSSPPTFGKLDRKNSSPRSRAEMPLP